MTTRFQPDWIVPDWPAPAHVKAVFTSRNGGVSPAPWNSLNLRSALGDDPAHVAANRQRVQDATGVPTVVLRQIHGCAVAHLRLAERADPPPESPVADACFTAERGLACSIQVADCLPVLMTNFAGDWVAGAHAGWRGLAGLDGAGGVLEQLIAHISAVADSNPAGSATKDIAPDLLVWLGPCIGPTAFEVGAEVRAAFVAADPAAAQCFQAGAADKWHADLAGLAKQRLRALGVQRIYGNDSSLPWCTVSNPLRFFSHRRDTARLGSSGRQAAFIWRV